MSDIVRILKDIAEDKGCIYHYGTKAAINVIDGTNTESDVFFLHEFTNRTTEMNSTNTRIQATVYDGKVLLVMQSSMDKDYFNETGNESQSKYTTNIEPLLTLFNEIGSSLLCAGYDVYTWSNIDITDALDANMNGLLISYKIRVMQNYSSSVIPPVGLAPVISNKLTGNYATAGSNFTLTITATNNPTSFSSFNLPDGLTLNETTGVITGILTDDVTAISFNISASNQYGTDSKIYFITTLGYNINELLPPQNLSVVSYNTVGISFMLSYDVRYYAPQYDRLEFFIDNVLYRTFINNNPINLNEPGNRQDLMQRVPALPVETPFEFKARFKSSNGSYSEFSETITVTIPQP